MVNREARLPGDDEWTCYMDVTLEEAAIRKARELEFDEQTSVIVFVRDRDDGDVFTVSVGVRHEYFVEGLRGQDL
jgi:hypothetical protein